MVRRRNKVCHSFLLRNFQSFYLLNPIVNIPIQTIIFSPWPLPRNMILALRLSLGYLWCTAVVNAGKTHLVSSPLRPAFHWDPSFLPEKRRLDAWAADHVCDVNSKFNLVVTGDDIRCQSQCQTSSTNNRDRRQNCALKRRYSSGCLLCGKEQIDSQKRTKLKG